MYLVDSDEMKQIDSYNINELGIPSLVLMERAALFVAEAVCAECDKKQRIVAVCGTGNNGGDGMAAARILYQRGYNVSIYMCSDSHLSEQAGQQMDIAKRAGVPFDTTLDIDEYTVVIDAIFGIGLSREVKGIYSEIISRINESRAHVIAVDIPSGVNASTGAKMGCAVNAAETVTFGFNKTGMVLYPGRSCAGHVTVADIGFFLPCGEENLLCPKVICPDNTFKLERRDPAGNKGTFGKVLIIAGHDTMAGAAALSARAAFRAGAGMVRVLTSEHGAAAVLSCVPEAMVEAYEKNGIVCKETVQSALEWATVVAVGMGIGTDKNGCELLDLVLESKNKPLVLDADALNILSMRIAQRLEGVSFNSDSEKINAHLEELSQLVPLETVLTPHMGELSRLLDCKITYLKENIIDIARVIAYNNNLSAQNSHIKLTYVMKDAATVTASLGNICINTSGNSGMAVAGSGDVLSGVIAGLLAGGMDSGKAGRLGVYLHGLAGDVAARKLGTISMTAGDIIEALPDAVLQMQ